jgi:chromosome segregation protein
VHLKSIKLRGFKSFVDPVEVRLERGVAVVVGPNGSGKSNISDSILWASGSLSPSELRAEKPDDVLFVGSAGRKPVDFCEVELLFDNEDGAWPGLDFSEISLARRLHRGGEGQYLVNRAPVRRLDLVELLSDVGLGGGLRSVISQGSVESVLGAKPSERRALVEEAAGLGRFKLRRHRAELKLSRVALQVDRARDIEAEVKKRLRPLALQATAAERAEKLRGEIASLQAAIAKLDLDGLAERRREADARRASAVESRKRLEVELESLLAERTSVEEELTDAAGAREGATAALYRLRADSERLELRREALGALAAQFAGEFETAGRTPADAGELQLAAREASAAAQAAAAEQTGLQLAAEDRWSSVAAWERATEAERARELDELLQVRNRLEQDLAGGGRDLLLALREASQRLDVRRESVERLRSGLARDRGTLQLTDGVSPAELGRLADEADAQARAKARERDDLRARAVLARDRAAALEQSLAEREGLAPAARALAEGGERLALSLLDVPPGAERAVAAALGRLGSALVVDDVEHGLRLIEQARSAGLGALVVLVARHPRDVVERLPVVAPEALLASTVPAVTADGIGWDPDRGELWFAGETAEAVLLELDARRRELVAESEQLERAAERAEREVHEAAEGARLAAEAFAPVAHLRNAKLTDAGLLDEVSRVADRLDETLRIAAAAARRLEQPVAERAAGAGEQLRTVAVREGELRQAVSAAATRALAAERHAGGRMSEPSDVRAEAEALSAQAAEAAHLAAATAQRAAVAARALAQVEGQAARRISPLVLERLAACAARVHALLAVEVDAFESPLRTRVEADASRTAELGSELRRLGAAEVELRRTTSEAAERLSTIDVELARADAERDEAQRRLTAAGTVEPADGDDRDELAVRLERLERRREQLGQVNPLAKEEYDAEKERLEELSVQRADLERSLEELEQLRRELTETVERRFAETFAAVERHFGEVAATLFPGGEGRLRLTEPDEDGEEPGIEVELRPAGKRVTRLSLLSGGEKALGAIAFLFSLFLARPSPFYLLDEVEAALDDTNIGRFTSLLRRYAGEAQFIVITHQKRTMEAADVLYGVTMGPEGVSQIVSRRLPHEAEQAATA